LELKNLTPVIPNRTSCRRPRSAARAGPEVHAGPGAHGSPAKADDSFFSPAESRKNFNHAARGAAIKNFHSSRFPISARALKPVFFLPGIRPAEQAPIFYGKGVTNGAG
jgi:hypothetical protein